MPAKKAAAGTPAARSPPPKSARQEVRQLRGELEDLLQGIEADDAAPAPVAQRRLDFGAFPRRGGRARELVSTRRCRVLWMRPSLIQVIMIERAWRGKH